jgi:hypothetical protein
MAAGVIGMSEALTDDFDGSMTRRGPYRGFAKKGQGEGRLVDDQQYRLPGKSEGDPKSHENNEVAQRIHNMAKGMAKKDSRGFGKYPCKCRH